MGKIKKGSWEELLLSCKKYGKDNIIKALETFHKQIENQAAYCWSEPHLHSRAIALDKILLKQDETLIRLRQMTDEDIAISLKTGKVGVHNS